VVVTLTPGLDRAALGAVLDEVNGALARDPMVSLLDSIELRPVAG
jgi:hypothetical protein